MFIEANQFQVGGIAPPYCFEIQRDGRWLINLSALAALSHDQMFLVLPVILEALVAGGETEIRGNLPNPGALFS